jgi:hypothetical protein
MGIYEFNDSKITHYLHTNKYLSHYFHYINYYLHYFINII